MTSDDLSSYLEGAAIAAETSEKVLPETAMYAAVAATLLRMGAAVARRGKDPVEHITRLMDLDAEWEATGKEADAEADRKFGL